MAHIVEELMAAAKKHWNTVHGTMLTVGHSFVMVSEKPAAPITPSTTRRAVTNALRCDNVPAVLTALLQENEITGTRGRNRNRESPKTP